MSLDEIIKSTNSETNNKSPGNNGLPAEFYKHFSNELAPVLLDVYDSWGKLGTMGDYISNLSKLESRYSLP